MTAPAKRLAMAFLRRAGGLAAVLAVIAGILGMHVMTGNHSMHSPAALTMTTESSAQGHSGYQASGTDPTHRASVQDLAAVCSGPCSDGCTSMQTMTASCTPSAKTGSLAAPLPGTTVFGAAPAARVTGALLSGYSYLPGGPTPGELSISRT